MAEPTPEATYEPHALKKVNETFHELLDTVDTLNVKIGQVLSAQESEFLRAYRGHMYGVQKEVRGLKEVASAAAATLARDSKVKEVETARDWYRAEAVRLDDVATRQRGELVALRERLSALTQDAMWQDERAREAAKQQNRLAAELESSRLLGATARAELGAESLEARQAAEAAAAEAAAAAATEAAAAVASPRSGVAAVGTATLALLSPARRKALLASLGGGGSGEAASPAAAAAAVQPSARERALQEELDALRLEVVGLREELEAERMGGGGSAGGGSAQQQQQQQQVAAKRRVLTPGGSRLVATPSTVSSQSASVASQNLPPGLKASSLGAIKGVK